MTRASTVCSGLIAVAFVAGPMMLEGQTSATSRQGPIKIQLQLQGYVGEVRAQELRMASFESVWNPGKGQFVESPTKSAMLSFQITIDAISPDGRLIQTREVIRVREGVGTSKTFDSSDPEVIRSLVRDPSRTEWFRRLITPLKVFQASTGEVRAAIADRSGVDLEQVLGEKNAVLPRNPVAVNESWSTGRHFYSVPTKGQLAATGTATLQAVSMEQGEEVAEIVETAVASFKPDQESATNYTMRDFQFRGRYRLLIERGILVASRREVSFVLVKREGSEPPVRYGFFVEIVAGTGKE